MTRRRAISPIKLVVGTAIAFAVAVGATMGLTRLTSTQVVTTTAVEGPVVQAFYSTGTVQPEREFPIKSNVAGILTEVRVDKGDRVKKGDPLAMVADPQLKYAADKARAELIERQK